MTRETKVALVTGASRGIGQAIVKHLANEGYNIAVNYHQSEGKAYALIKEITDMGVRALPIKADVSNATEVEAMFTELEKNLGHVSVLINNAGISSRGLVTEIEEKEWDQVIGVNLKGTFLCCKRALPHMISNRYGRIVNISSVWGITGASYESVYAASKGGLITFTKSLAKEVGPSGITANAIAPGPIETDMLDEELDYDEKQALIDMIPMRRLGKPQDVADLCGYLVSNHASFINGQVIGVDGGFNT